LSFERQPRQGGRDGLTQTIVPSAARTSELRYQHDMTPDVFRAETNKVSSSVP
jgi:hypothetical protein